MTIDISLIIPVHSNEESIDYLLSSLSNISIENIKAEVIFVADKCKQKTINRLQRWCLHSNKKNDFQATFLESAFLNPDAARDMALKYASGLCVGFIDDDCTPSTQWLQRAVLQCHKYGAATGPVCHRESLMGNLCAVMDFGEFQDKLPSIRSNAPGCNLAFRLRHHFPAKYPVLADAPYCGDRILANIVSDHFKGIYYDPEMEIFHDPSLTLADIFKREIRYGEVAWNVREHNSEIAWSWILKLGFFAPFFITAGRFLIDAKRTLNHYRLSPHVKLIIIFMLIPLRIPYLSGAFKSFRTATIHFNNE